ncbi:hypothetical protein [Streptomyces roseolus]|uniref:hypothetical protein n=1 Tax=Streptomyces roseolus TaxID=67358 RepID=UPI00366A2DB0
MADPPPRPGRGLRGVVLTAAVVAGLCGAVALVTVLCLHLFGVTGSQEVDTEPLPGAGGEPTSPDRPYDPFRPPAQPAVPPPLPPHPGTYR